MELIALEMKSNVKSALLKMASKQRQKLMHGNCSLNSPRIARHILKISD